MDKVMWYEGMLLRPQHFQQQERYQDHQVRMRTSLPYRNHWGFFTLTLDRQQLASGQVVLKEASGIFPDGTLFNTASFRETLALHLPAGAEKTQVYLALPSTTEQSIANRRSDQPDVTTRYVSDEHTITDNNAGERSECQMLCSQHDYRLVSDKEGLAGYTYLQIATVLHVKGDGVIALDPDFQATFLHSDHAPLIEDCLNETLSMLAHRGNVLAGRLSAQNRLGTAELGDFLMLQMINRVEPTLRHYASTDRVHPEEVYLTLSALAGELATYRSGHKRIEQHIPYQHHNQCHSFSGLMDTIRDLLSQVLEEHALELPLEKRQYGVMVSPLTDKKLLSSSMFVIEARAALSPDVLQHKLPLCLKAGRIETIRDLVNLQLCGLPVTPLPVAPRELPYDKRCSYFALSIEPEEIAAFEQSAGFAFHVSGEFENLSLKLWAIRNH